MVWASTMLNACTNLHIFDGSKINGQGYRDGVLIPNVRFFRGAVRPDFVYG